MSGRHGVVQTPTPPLVFLLFLVLIELVILAIGLLLVDSGWRVHPSPSPAPMVTGVQLPDVAGDGS